MKIIYLHQFFYTPKMTGVVGTRGIRSYENVVFANPAADKRKIAEPAAGVDVCMTIPLSYHAKLF